MDKRHSYGFTLLEVMMALAILAIAGTALVGTVRESISHSTAMTQLIPARWIADNALTDIYLDDRWPSSKWTESVVNMAGRQWHLKIRSSKTADKDFRLIEVEVRADKKQKTALATLQTHLFKRDHDA